MKRVLVGILILSICYGIQGKAENRICEETEIGSTAVSANVEFPDETQNETENPSEEDAVRTSDASHPWVYGVIWSLSVLVIFVMIKVRTRMKRNGIWKKLCAVLLVVAMLVPASLGHVQAVERTPFQNNVTNRLYTDLFNICSRSLCKCLGAATEGMSDNSLYQLVNEIVFGNKKNVAAELCEEILKDTKEIKEDVKDSREYLAGLITEFESTTNRQHLSDCTSEMNDILTDTQEAWNAYYACVEAVNTYGNNSTQSNLDQAKTKANLLFAYLDEMDFSGQMTKFISCVSTKLAHYEGEGTPNASETYLYWLYQICQNEYVFDYQKYEVLQSAISWNVGEIEKMMELHAMYISKLKYDYDNGSSTLSDDEIKMAVAEYNNCMNMGINACNDIAGQYADEMQKMVRRYDLDTEYLLDYESSSQETGSFSITGLFPDKREFTYQAHVSKTSAKMPFYRVSIDGKTYLFLKQDETEITAADLFEKFSKDKEDVDLTSLYDPNFAMKSRDWLNLTGTADGNYEGFSDLSQVYQMVGKMAYAKYGKNFLNYIQAGGGLADVAGTTSGNPTTYLFLDSMEEPSIARGDALIDSDMQLFAKANWPNLSDMSLTDGKFDDSCMETSDSFATMKDQNVLVMMKETDDAVFSYAVTQKVTGMGNMQVLVNDTVTESGGKIEAGEVLAIRVKPDEYQTLESLTIQGVKKSQGEELNVTLAADGDYKYMQMDEDGYATYYFTMPYQDCTITANFVRETARDTHRLFTEITGKGQYRILDQYDEATISLSREDASGMATFGESLALTMLPDDNWYVKNVKLTTYGENPDERTTLMNLSTLEESHFVMPDQDCILEIEFAELKEEGTIDDPYLIPTYKMLEYYASCMLNGDSKGQDAEHYKNAHYRVTADLNCDASITAPFSGMQLKGGGSFDGQGYQISNLASAVGLFYSIDQGAVVKNVILNHVQKCYGNQGVTLVYSNAGTIDGCEVRNTDDFTLAYNKDKGEIGGLVYQNTETGVIRNSGIQNDCKLFGQYVGGIAYTNNGTIQNCYFSGEIVLPAADNARAGGIFENGMGTVDNCYASSSLNLDSYSGSPVTDTAGAIVSKNTVSGLAEGCISNCYYNADASGYEVVSAAGITAKSTSELASDDFVSILNGKNQDGYQIWKRSNDVNGGFPVFDAAKLYYLNEEVTGSGAIVASRENGGAASLGIAAGETIHLQIVSQPNVELVSLKVCKKDDPSVICQEFENASEEVTFQMPAYDATVIAEFTNLATEYTIGSKIDGLGEIYILNDTGADITSARVNQTVHVKAVPGVGYSLRTFELRDADGTTIQTFSQAEDSFVTEARKTVVYAEFTKNQESYTLEQRVEGDGKGSVELTDFQGESVGAAVKPYTNIKVKATPADGSYPSSIQLVSQDGTVLNTLMDSYEDYMSEKKEDGSFETSFAMPAQNATIIVTFSGIPVLYDVTAETIGDGTIRVNKQSGTYAKLQATEGTVLEILAYANKENGGILNAAVYDEAGTKLEDLKADPSYEPLAKEVQYVYTVPAKNVTIQIEFDDSAVLEPNEGGNYEITSFKDLVTMAKMVKRDPDQYAGASYVQTKNINCQKGEWSLEIGTEEAPFTGTYDGKGYYILGLRPTGSVSGLFGVVGSAGIVKNVSVVDFDYAEAPEMASGLVGVNYGTIDHCGSGVNFDSNPTTFFDQNKNPVPLSTLNSDIQATVVAGGLVAVNEGTIKNSRNNAVVSITGESEESCAGGVAAKNEGVIINIYNVGKITGGTYAGGIVGTNSGSIQYGYHSRIVTGTCAGAVVGKTDNTEIKDLFYNSEMTAGAGSTADSELGITSMAAADMKTKAFADQLNQLIQGQELKTWTYDASKNEGFPRFSSDNVADKLLVSIKKGEIDGITAEKGDSKDSASGGNADQTTDTSEKKQNIKTGDETSVWVWMLLLLASMGTILTVALKKKRFNR